jgi:hypothetical protein
VTVAEQPAPGKSLQELVEQRRYGEALELARRELRADPANRQLAATVAELEATTHWSMLPMWPLFRFGWVGAVAVFGTLIVAMQLLRSLGGIASSASFSAVVLAYILYSWMWPPALRRLMRRKHSLPAA